MINIELISAKKTENIDKKELGLWCREDTPSYILRIFKGLIDELISIENIFDHFKNDIVAAFTVNLEENDELLEKIRKEFPEGNITFESISQYLIKHNKTLNVEFCCYVDNAKVVSEGVKKLAYIINSAYQLEFKELVKKYGEKGKNSLTI